MKRGAHLQAPGPAGVLGGFEREFMLFLDGISVGGQITRERERVIYLIPVLGKEKKSSLKV